MRIGIGHDTHRLEERRPLLLGGVHVEHPQGLAGHSDADVVFTPLTDALLGAAGLGDIGDAYPDTDPKWHRRRLPPCFCTNRRSSQAGRLALVNLDVIIFAQAPKLGPVKQAIRENLGRPA